MSTKRITWDGNLTTEAVELLDQGGKIIVSPTKVGYIIMTTDLEGLEHKFEIKKRKRNKPGVVLCGSMEQLRELADMTPEIEKFYQMHWDQDALMGCILPWKESGKKYIPEGAEELMTDVRGTSCFVLRFGTPGEQIVNERWEKSRALSFASSANPSGRGNRGVVDGIGDAIENGVDLIIEGNDYVKSIQPNATPETRYEQGVMVSFVDDDGNLVPEQHGARDTEPAPILIRKGVYLPQILDNLAECFNSWDYRHGHYY